MSNTVDWVVHYVANTGCEMCGKNEESFLPYLCNAHTHGMNAYNHPDFQVVLNFGMEEVCRILNELGRRVQAGKRFSAGEMVFEEA